MLVNCVAYQEGRKLADIDKRQISEYLARPGCFVWVALKEPTEVELEEMREDYDRAHAHRRAQARRDERIRRQELHPVHPPAHRARLPGGARALRARARAAAPRLGLRAVCPDGCGGRSLL